MDLDFTFSPDENNGNSSPCETALPSPGVREISENEYAILIQHAQHAQHIQTAFSRKCIKINCLPSSHLTSTITRCICCKVDRSPWQTLPVVAEPIPAQHQPRRARAKPRPGPRERQEYKRQLSSHEERDDPGPEIVGHAFAANLLQRRHMLGIFGSLILAFMILPLCSPWFSSIRSQPPESRQHIAELRAHIQPLEDKFSSSGGSGSCPANQNEETTFLLDQVQELQETLGMCSAISPLCAQLKRDSHDVLEEFVADARASGQQLTMSSTDSLNRSLLHIAGTWGKTAAVAALLNSKDSKTQNHQDQVGNAALHHAALQGHGDVVSLLLASKIFNMQNHQNHEGATALHIAAHEGHVSVATALLGHKNFSAFEAQKPDKATALDVARRFNRASVANLLLQSVQNVSNTIAKLTL